MKFVRQGVELSIAALELLVDRRQLFVGRLQFLFGGLELLVRALQLFVARQHLFVGRAQLLIGGLLRVEDRLEVVFARCQFLAEPHDVPILGGAIPL